MINNTPNKKTIDIFNKNSNQPSDLNTNKYNLSKTKSNI